MKELQAKAKVTQTMTRDGLVVENQADGTVENVSSREAEPDYSTDAEGKAEKILERAEDIKDGHKNKKKASVKKLENKGLIKRKQSKDNKKHIEIVLLDDAALIVDAGLNAQKQFAQNVLRGLTEEEKHVCMNVFDKICNNAEELLRGESK